MSKTFDGTTIICQESWTKNHKMFLLPIVVLALVATPSLANSASAFSYNANYPATETDSTGYAFLKDTSTGVSVTISNSDRGVSFGFMDQKITTPTNGEGGANLGNPQYYGIALLGISGGNTRICIPDSSGDPNTTIQYWNANTWSTLSNISFDSSQVCGSVSVYSFIGDGFTYMYTDVAVGDLSHG